MEYKSYDIKKGVTLHYLKTDKFKTANLTFFIRRPLEKGEVTKNALVSSVIRRGCPVYKTSMELSNAMSELYGAEVDTGIKKKGDNQIITVSFSFANEKFVPGHPEILKEIFKIADSMILKQDSFNPDYVNQEKENLKSLILAQKNDKRQYAQARCIQCMCENEAYGIPRYGFAEKVDEITDSELFSHYKDIILASGTDIFLCGDIDIDIAKNAVSEMYRDIEIKYPGYAKCEILNAGEVKNITETEPVAQGKLSMGFRTGITNNSELYPAMILYNAILGGGIFSKLFNNVREKLSLCYYASSAADCLKGVMFINSGIETANFQKAYDEILCQMKDMENGVISEEEFNAAKLGTVNNLRSITDSAFGTAEYYLGKIVSGRVISLEELILMIDRTTPEQVKEAARQVKLDTVYFLKGEGDAK